MEMLGHAPTSNQPTFCNLGRCRRPWPRRRGGACRSVQQQDRAIRAGGAPVRGKSERRADGAAIDWRTAGLSTDACLNQTRRAAGEGDICGHLGTRQAARCARTSRGMHAGTRRRQADVQFVVTQRRAAALCREVGCAALQTIRREYAAPPHGSVPSTNLTASELLLAIERRFGDDHIPAHLGKHVPPSA
jgi:hypothetical protein